MRIKLPFYFIIGLGALFINSCVDDKYDLDNLDSTIGIRLDNLVVPVNMSTIELDQVFDVSDNSLIVKFPENADKSDQYYAIMTDGSFTATDVHLDYFEANEISVETKTFPVVNGTLTDAFTNYSYKITDIDKSLVNLSSMSFKEPMCITLEMTDAGNDSPVKLQNMVISIPETFNATYNGQPVENGKVNIGDFDGQISEPIYVWEIDYRDKPLTPTDNPDNPEYKILEISGQNLGIVSANVATSGIGNIKMSFAMSSFVANNVSGAIDYEIETPHINPVSLSNLPDFLKDGNSNIILGNPQIYLNFENPVGAAFNTDLKITPQGNGGKAFTEILDPFISTFILAASDKNLALKSGVFENTKPQTSDDLKNILSGNGLPESIEFNLENTFVKGEIKSLDLGTDLHVGGEYTFFCPLSFENGSFIRYQKKETDFFSDDLTKVNVEKLRLEANPKSDFPFDVTLTVYPLDREGNHIFDNNGQEIKAEGVVEAYPNEKPLILDFNQPFQGLNGVEFIVLVDKLEDETLKPTQTITLNNIRATVSGEYISIDDKYKKDYE